MPHSCQFLTYLVSEFARRKKQNARYSLRAYAKQLNIASSLLSRILKGRTPLSSKMLKRFNEHLKIPSDLYIGFMLEIRDQEDARKAKVRRLKTSN